MDYFPDCTPGLLQETLDILDRWSSRSEAHVSKRRKRRRFAYRGIVKIQWQINPLTSRKQGDVVNAVFHVTARNVSQGGVGLIVPPTFIPSQISDDTPILFSEGLFREGRHVFVMLEQSGSTPRPLPSLIVRQRRVHHDFFEIGLQFVGRDGDFTAANDEPAVADAPFHSN